VDSIYLDRDRNYLDSRERSAISLPAERLFASEEDLCVIELFILKRS
jgi:hypothetical protein